MQKYMKKKESRNQFSSARYMSPMPELSSRSTPGKFDEKPVKPPIAM